MKITFEFSDERNPDDLHLVNEALSGMGLSELKIADSDGYLQTQIKYKDEVPQETIRRYGFDKLVLECKCNEEEGLCHYQIDTEAIEKGQINSSSVYHDLWCAQHPERIMRVLTQISFDKADVFIVLHHEKEDS